jgi:hydroxymethylglutaryl-CoA reductase (NADPH)
MRVIFDLRRGPSRAAPVRLSGVSMLNFLARQFYVSGSLRNTNSGWELQAHNPMGDGTLVGVGKMRVDGREIPADAVTARRSGEAEPIRATEVSRSRPVSIFKGDRVTLHVDGEPLAAGSHKLEIELFEINLGRLAFSISDNIEG